MQDITEKISCSVPQNKWDSPDALPSPRMDGCFSNAQSSSNLHSIWINKGNKHPFAPSSNYDKTKLTAFIAVEEILGAPNPVKKQR